MFQLVMKYIPIHTSDVKAHIESSLNFVEMTLNIKVAIIPQPNVHDVFTQTVRTGFG